MRMGVLVCEPVYMLQRVCTCFNVFVCESVYMLQRVSTTQGMQLIWRVWEGAE